jgi:MFS family permease
LLRIAGSAGVLVIGGYFVELQDKGLPITSVLVGVVAGLVYLTELLLAPPAGALSDGRGRKSFLLAGPLLAAFAVLLPPLGFLTSVLPSMALVVGLLALSRLVEGLGSAASVPATFSFLSEGTDHAPLRKGRQMSFYELAASGGVAVGAVLGPLLWSALHLFASLPSHSFISSAPRSCCLGCTTPQACSVPDPHSIFAATWSCSQTGD